MGGSWSSSEVAEDAESAARQTGGTHPRGGPAEGLSAIFLAETRRGRDATRCRWASGAGADTRIDDTNFAGAPIIPVVDF